MQQLANIAVAVALVLSCWGGALADAACRRECDHSEAHSSRARASCAGREESPAPHEHATTPAGHAHGSHHAAETAAPEAGEALAAESAASALSAGTIASRHGLCDHCMGRPEAPPQSATDREAGRPKNDGAAGAAGAGVALLRPTVSFVREVIPHGDGPPPPTSRRHLLLSVFRI